MYYIYGVSVPSLLNKSGSHDQKSMNTGVLYTCAGNNVRHDLILNVTMYIVPVCDLN